jgi:hypothetical protein
MPYYKFKKNEIYRNTLKTYPSIKYITYSGSSYYNNVPNLSGAFANPIRLTDSGHVSLYEMNIDRVSSSTGRFIGTSPAGPTAVPDNGLIYSFMVKNGTRMGFRTLATTASWDAADYGQVLFGDLPYTSSISMEFYNAETPRSATSQTAGAVSHLLALKNTINHYRYINPQFQYSSSVRDFNSIDLGLVNIPTIFYGSSIKKGTIDLKYYITGTLLARAQDTNQNGLLYSTYGVMSGSVIGLALYGEGLLLLTSSANLTLDSAPHKDYYTSSAGRTSPRWTFFGQTATSILTSSATTGGPTVDTSYRPAAASASFVMDMSGTTNTQTLTMFANAHKGQLNQSNNPTFLQYSTANYAATGSVSYIENNEMQIKNVVSSAYADPTGSFEKTTYISKVGIYDDNKNLIAIAKMATPVRKTVERDFTFKIKLDL